ncbi:hypothetical protein MHM95_12495 [Pseudoalteromonas sp. CnMc7-15]|uniref:hypothetical protein n=1 Tax=unclassified Pseudoalteromonas TaxID=194690 RepID=UPI001EF63FC9|nr:hypothetical protein [Pseudoalteromonas sp. CnMc7-15]MCG7567100.1 hypothetical protein [Pseudoalteromonas sp. CnMc7-15]
MDSFINEHAQVLMLIYRTVYYGGAVAVTLGMLIIVAKTKCTPAELVARRYSHYYQDEISAFITFTSVMVIYFGNAFGLPLIDKTAEKFIGASVHNQEIREFMYGVARYTIKALCEFLLIAIIGVLHSIASVKYSKFTRVIAFISVSYGIWHILRAFDNLILKTQILDGWYPLISTVMTGLVTSYMLYYSVVMMTKKKEL